MRYLNSGHNVPRTIKTSERIFKVETVNDEKVLCNVATAQMLLKDGVIKNLWHLWDFEWKRFGKNDLKQM
jgi:hypothetical protein